MPLATTPDHVAVAVPSIDAAAKRWHDMLGGSWIAPRFPSEQAGFAARQLAYPGGARLELLEPMREDSFPARFIARFGARVHHVTLKVPDLLEAVEQAQAAGFDAVDVFADGDVWHEAFLRPSQVGGLIVQLAWQGRSDEEWAELLGVEPEPVNPAGARLLGPRLTHPDLDDAARIWTALGAEVHTGTDHLDVLWADAPLSVEIRRGPHAGPVGVRVAGAEAADEHPELGAAVFAV